ncbi:MAG TPA: hypothetical protein VGL99_29240 [Chloroflexota bacterium]
MRRSLMALVATLAVLSWSSTALADATPIQLVLLHMPDVSNTGSPAASGIAELVLLEGEVRISATGLTHLEGDSEYVAWLVNSETNQFVRLGAFNAKDDGVVHYENVLDDAIPNKRWNLLLLTVETSATPGKPGPKHSIAGVFPRSDRDPPPQLLPNTGGLDDPAVVSGQWLVVSQANWLMLSGLATLTVVVAGTAGYAVGRRHR